jgi:hypothetical protein
MSQEFSLRELIYGSQSQNLDLEDEDENEDDEEFQRGDVQNISYK